MTTPFVGEIRMFGFPRTPTGWQACDGSLLSIGDFSTLFTLIGTTYGGNGQTNFAVPDLRGQIPIHQGAGQGRTPRVLGQKGGEEQVVLTLNQIPSHTHLVVANTQAASTATPGSSVILGPGATGDELYFSPPTGGAAEPMATNSGQPVGGSEPHDNCAPTLTVSFCIAWEGVFPSQ